MNFERLKLGLTHDQHLEPSNSDHSRTTSPLIVFYFLAHLCVISLLVQTLKKYKNTHSKEKIEIYSNLGWKYGTLLIGDGALVSNRCLYHIWLFIIVVVSFFTMHHLNVTYTYGICNIEQSNLVQLFHIICFFSMEILSFWSHSLTLRN